MYEVICSKKHFGNCELCNRTKNRAFHHLIPKVCHKNKWFKKNFSKIDMTTRGLMLCRNCHKYIHICYTEKELGKKYNTREALMEDEKIAKFLKFIRKKH